MRFRAISLLGTFALVAAVGASLAPAAGASVDRKPGVSASGRVAHRASPSGTTIKLYDQNNNDSGVGIVSQRFTDPGGALTAYNSGAADDFVVPAGQTWTVQEVVVTGVYFNGFGPADSEEVRVYPDAGGLPGAPQAIITNLHGTDSGGSFDITLGTDLVLTEGHYWVGVRVNMPFGTGQGEWGFESRSVQSNSPAAWRNKHDGFLTGCTTWQKMVDCIGPQGEGPDFMFALYGHT